MRRPRSIEQYTYKDLQEIIGGIDILDEGTDSFFYLTSLWMFGPKFGLKNYKRINPTELRKYQSMISAVSQKIDGEHNIEKLNLKFKIRTNPILWIPPGSDSSRGISVSPGIMGQNSWNDPGTNDLITHHILPEIRDITKNQDIILTGYNTIWQDFNDDKKRTLVLTDICEDVGVLLGTF